MRKLLGAALLTAGGVWLGLCRVWKLGRRMEALRALIGLLGRWERELGERQPPMEELLRAGAEHPGPLRPCLTACLSGLDRLGETSFAAVWAESFRDLPLGAEEWETVAELGEVLGRYGPERQAAALRRGAEELEEALKRAREDRRREGKLSLVLGGSAGLLGAIVLL